MTGSARNDWQEAGRLGLASQGHEGWEKANTLLFQACAVDTQTVSRENSLSLICRAFLQVRRGGRVAEGARLESVYGSNVIVGSNPTLSAKIARYLPFSPQSDTRYAALHSLVYTPSGRNNNSRAICILRRSISAHFVGLAR